MSVYNRKMFRGSRPTAQDAQQAVDVGITSVMADMTRGVKAAENFEQAINAFRGDQKPMKERRQELAGIVGMKDAKKTPESVVTLVQPVMEMRQASEKVDQGIGQVAQQAMNTPVKGNMAGGIMQPLQMKAGGAARLAELYKQNMPVVQDMFGDQSAALKKQALGQLLLGGVAPAGLAIAQGTPVSEALMQLGPYAAQLGAGVQQSKMKQDAAARQAALNLATTQQAAEVAAAAKAQEEKGFAPGSVIRKGGKTVATVPFKPEKYTPVTLFNQASEGKRVFSKEEEQAAVQAGFNLPSPPTTFKGITLYNKAGDYTRVLSREDEQAAIDQGYTLTSPPKKEGRTVVYKKSPDNLLGYETMEIADSAPAPEGWTRDKFNVGGSVDVVDTATDQVVRRNELFLQQQPAGKFIRPKPNTQINVFDKDGTKMPIMFSEFDPAIHSMQDPTERVEIYPQSEITFKGETLAINKPISLPKSVVDKLPEGSFSTSAAPADKTVLVTAKQAGTYGGITFEKGEEKRIPESVARANVNAFGKLPKAPQFTKSKSFTIVNDLADKIENGTETPTELSKFSTAMAALQSPSGISIGDDGNITQTGGGEIPVHVKAAIQKRRENDPEFPDFGLTEVVVEALTEGAFQLLFDENIDAPSKIGARAKIQRLFTKGADIAANLFLGRNVVAGADSREFVDAINNLNQTSVISLAKVMDKPTQQVMKDLRNLTFDPNAATLTLNEARGKTKAMVTYLENVEKEVDAQLEAAIASGATNKINKANTKKNEITNMLTQYRGLERMLNPNESGLGSPHPGSVIDPSRYATPISQSTGG